MKLKNTSSYIFQKVNVSVVFYNLSHLGVVFKTVGFLGLTKFHHCGIVFTMGDNSIVLAFDRRHRAKFFDTKKFHDNVYSPCETIDLGTANVSIKQLTDYITVPYIATLKNIVFWYYITHGLLRLKHLQPKSCGLLSSNILRLCGYSVIDCVSPKQLYKELKKICN